MARGRAKRVVPADPPLVDRHPRSTQASRIQVGKRPRREFTPSDAEGKLIVLFSRVDVSGPWRLTKITVADHLTLLDRIRGFESMTVHQVFNNDGRVGKDYEVAKLPTRRAEDRLLELQLDDRDVISRLQIGGAQRLYGFRERSRFYILWWDPEHEIYPSPKKHT